MRRFFAKAVRMRLSLGAGWRKTDKFSYLCRRMRASVKKIYASLRPDALVAFWLGVWWICNLFQAGFTELANDEAYYHMFAERLAWGYFDHPPVTALLVWAGERLFGGELGVRVVPQAVARYGAYIAPGAILMPSYVNIGAYVDTGTMVDTWATVGSCAQIGRHVHLSGGVGIGGVLEPVQAAPVIIEDNCFIGSRSIVVEGAHVCREAVLGSNTVITGSTHIIDVTGPEPVTYKGYVPPRSVVVPGSYRKQFPAGEYSITCALIIGQRKESTDKKTSLNDALRDFGVSV